jgi:DNA-binding NarL/FixJ family response regulator
MSSRRKIRLLLVDDHAVVRMGLAFMINSQPDITVVGEAGSGAEALELLGKTNPDVVLMDLKLPDMTGIECTTKLRKTSPDARIVILTTYAGDENIYRALQAGARAYLLKDMDRDEILGTIRAVDAGQTCLPPTVAASLAQRLPEAELSRREISILRSIAQGSSNKEIGCELGISESTVKGHVNHVLSKLKARDRTEAVTVALRRGLISLD